MPLNKEFQWESQCDAVQLSFFITDVARYTTTLKLTISSLKVQIYQDMTLIVRLYHDVKMMEVMEGFGPSALKAVHSPFFDMKPEDEKKQINIFIGENLNACIKNEKYGIHGMIKYDG